jgi:hypothetical protein
VRKPKKTGRPPLPAAAKNTPAPDPAPQDEPDNEPGSVSLDVAKEAPGGVQMVALPPWALGLAAASLSVGFLGIGLAIARRN